MPKTASALSASRKVDLPMLRAKQSSDSGEAFPRHPFAFGDLVGELGRNLLAECDPEEWF
jgi:hypothetical protein